VRILGVHGEFGQSAYMADQLYAKHGLDAAGIASAAQALV
jgi:transketolase C-terminal domain/subunit